MLSDSFSAIAYAPDIPSSGFVLLNISSITIKENLSSLDFVSLSNLSIWFLDLCISASNNDSFPLQSGIFRYVFIKVKGVNSNLDASAIPNVCDKSNEILTLFINVDLPPAFGPVRIRLFGWFIPILILLWTIL